MTTSPGLTTAAIARARASTRGRSPTNRRCASSSSDTSGYRQLLSWETPPPSEIEPKPLCVSFATLPYSVTTGVGVRLLRRRAASAVIRLSVPAVSVPLQTFRSRAHRSGTGIACRTAPARRNRPRKTSTTDTPVLYSDPARRRTTAPSHDTAPSTAVPSRMPRLDQFHSWRTLPRRAFAGAAANRRRCRDPACGGRMRTSSGRMPAIAARSTRLVVRPGPALLFRDRHRRTRRDGGRAAAPTARSRRGWPGGRFRPRRRYRAGACAAR